MTVIQPTFRCCPSPIGLRKPVSPSHSFPSHRRRWRQQRIIRTSAGLPLAGGGNKPNQPAVHPRPLTINTQHQSDNPIAVDAKSKHRWPLLLSPLLVGIGLPVDRLSLFPPATPNEPRLPAFCAIHTALSFATTVRLMFGTATQIMEDNDGEENVDSNFTRILL
jgi:hypothetical protein